MTVVRSGNYEIGAIPYGLFISCDKESEDAKRYNADSYSVQTDKVCNGDVAESFIKEMCDKETGKGAGDKRHVEEYY